MSTIPSRFRLLVVGLIAMGASLGQPVSASAQELKSTMVDKENDLLVGPLDVELEIAGEGGPIKKKVQLQFLTRQYIVYREFETKDQKDVPKESVRKADGTSNIRAVRCAAPKGAWTWDEKKREFTGTPIPPAKVSILKAKDAPENLKFLLLLKAERIFLSLGNALAVGDAKRAEEWVAYADRLKQLAEKSNVPAQVSNLFDLKSYSEAQKKRREELVEELEKLRKTQVEAARTLRAIQAQYQAEAGLAGLGLLFGGGAIFGSDDAKTQRFGRDLILAGGDDLFAAGLRKSREEARLKGFESQYEEKATGIIRDLRKAFGAAESELAEQLAVSWKSLGIDSAKLRKLDALAAEVVKDPAAAVELFDDRLKFLDEKALFDPSCFCSRIKARAKLLALPAASEEDKFKRVSEMMQMAHDAVAATAKIPVHTEFDPDRVALLSEAGRLIHGAVNYAHSGSKYGGPRRWSEFYDPRADEGIRILDEALLYTGEFGDRDGEIRANRAWLLLQRGLREMALVEAQKIEALREADATTQYNLAKIYAQNGNTKEAAKRFEQAVKFGFRDLDGAAADGDVAFVKAQKYWSEYATFPKLTVIHYTTEQRGQSYTLEIKNTGELPLVNAKIFFTTDKQNKLPPLATEKIDYLAPGHTYYWIDACKSTPREIQAAGLLVELPQIVFPQTSTGAKGKPKPLGFLVKPDKYNPYAWWY